MSAYRLRLLRYQVENGRAARKEIITFAVGADITSVRLPDDVLKPEGHYLIELSAVSPHYKAEDAGSLFVVPYARGTTLSGLLSTP